MLTTNTHGILFFALFVVILMLESIFLASHKNQIPAWYKRKSTTLFIHLLLWSWAFTRVVLFLLITPNLLGKDDNSGAPGLFLHLLLGVGWPLVLACYVLLMVVMVRMSRAVVLDLGALSEQKIKQLHKYGLVVIAQQFVVQGVSDVLTYYSVAPKVIMALCGGTWVIWVLACSFVFANVVFRFHKGTAPKHTDQAEWTSLSSRLRAVLPWHFVVLFVVVAFALVALVCVMVSTIVMVFEDDVDQSFVIWGTAAGEIVVALPLCFSLALPAKRTLTKNVTSHSESAVSL